MQITQRTVKLLVSLTLCGIAILLAPSREANAQISAPQKHPTDCTNTKKEIVIYHINGVFTDSRKAWLSTEALNDFLIYGWTGAGYTPIRELLNPSAAYAVDKVCFIVDLLENPSTPNLGDLLEAAHQLDGLDPKDYWLTLSDLTSFPLGVSQFKLLERLAVASTDSSVINSAKIQAHATKIAEDIRDHCRSILLVPHSQGNLWAHNIYDKVLQDSSIPAAHVKEAIRIVGVGSADVEGPSPYRDAYTWKTNHGDILMGDNVPLLFPFTLSNDGLLRQLHPTLYDANTNWTSSGLLDWFNESGGHSFAGYLRFEPSQKDLRDALKKALQILPPGSCFQFFQSPYSFPPNAGTVTITVKRYFGGQQVRVQTRNGTATDGVDYTAVTRTLIFQPTDTEQTFNLTLLNDPKGAGKFLNLELVDPLTERIVGKTTLTLATCIESLPESLRIPKAGVGINSKGTEAQGESISLALDDGTSSASVNGTRGDFSATASGITDEPGYLDPRTAAGASDYRSFMITSPGKSNSFGTGVITTSGYAEASNACGTTEGLTVAIASAVIEVLSNPDGNYVRAGYYDLKKCGDWYKDISGARPATASFSFHYGPNYIIPFEYHVSASTRAAYGGISGVNYGLSSGAALQFTISVPDDPNAIVTFCTAPPPPTP